MKLALMIGSGLFQKIFLAVMAISIGFVITLYIFTVPMIRRTVYSIEEDSAKTILDNVHNLVQSEYYSIQAYREVTLASYKRQLKNITLSQVEVARNKYRLFTEGKMSEAEAKDAALCEIREFRYGSNDYVWVSDYNNVLISHPDPQLNDTDFSNVRDTRWNLIVPPLVNAARENKEGYSSYWWRRLGERKPIEKITYGRDFPEWKWVFGTGVYVDDIDFEVSRRKEKMIQELRDILLKTRIANTGYMYIFDANYNMIIHPNPNIDQTNFRSMKNLLTNRPIVLELIDVADKKDNKLLYLWDKPDDRGNYIYEKLSWVRYFEGFDWYLASSVYTEELNKSASVLRDRILIISFLTVMLFLWGAFVFLRRILLPIGTLSQLALKAGEGDLSVCCSADGKDEIGLLGRAFNNMILRLKENIEELDAKVKERTAELTLTNEKLQMEVEERKRAEKINNALFQISSAVNTIFDPEPLYAAIHKTLNEIVRAENFYVALYYRAGGLFQFPYFVDERMGKMTFDGRYHSQSLYPVANEIIRQGKTLVFDRPEIQSMYRGSVRGYAPEQWMGAPLWIKDEIMGIISVWTYSRITYRKKSMDVLTSVADQVAIAIERKKSHENLLAANRELKRLSHMDGLTHIANRRRFDKSLKEEWYRLRREKCFLSLLLIDVDYFKSYNDTYGHQKGDDCLRIVAKVLEENARRPADLVARYGGEEFAILLPKTPPENAYKLAQGVCLAVKERKILHSQSGLSDYLTVSIGVAGMIPRNDDDPDHLVKKADEALYAAKNQGRDRVAAAKE